MNDLKNKRQQTELANLPIRNRLLGAMIAAVLVAWWGVHFNGVFQAIRALNETQLENPTGTHVLGGMDVSAGLAGVEAYAIGAVIIFCTVCIVWPVLAFVPRKSVFWRLPVLMVAGVSLPVIVVATEAAMGATRSIDKWSDAGPSHLFFDIAGYLALGLTYGFAVWLAFKTYILRQWKFWAWAGLGFAVVAVPASVLLFQHGRGLIPVLGDVSWPIAETLFCIAGAFVAGFGWLGSTMTKSRLVRRSFSEAGKA